MPFTSLGKEGGKSGLRRQELKLIFQRIINIAKEEQVDLLLICGDLFEHFYVKKSTTYFICDELAKIPQTEVFIIPGNHDPYCADSYYSSFEWPKNVHIIFEDNYFVELKELGVCVFGNKSEAVAVNPSLINIQMIHGTFDMNFVKNAYNPLSKDNLLMSGMDYIALGHFHNKFQYEGLVYNPGSPEPLGFDEEGEHGVFMCTITKQENDTEIDTNFISLNKRFYRNMRINVDGCNTDESIEQKVSEAIEPLCAQNDLYNITLKGAIGSGFRINTAKIEECIAKKVFFIRIKDETVPEYNFDELIKEPGLRGLFVKKMLEKAQNTLDGEERKLVIKALYYGMEAIDQGEVNVY